MTEHWDVIIVGARCAGATLATLLAKQGVRTLLLEASSRGTDMPMSTHLVQPPGMGVLDRLGLGQRVREVTPPSARFRFALDDASLVVHSEPQHAPYCVRRSTLDPWLQDVAEQAGAELRFRHRVIDLVRARDGRSGTSEPGDERVTGVVVSSPEGKSTLYADLVVGADGVRSTIAQLTGVEQYLLGESSRAGYWTYYDAPAVWEAEWDSTLEHRGDDLRYVFRTDGGQVLLTYVGKRELVTQWGADRRARLDEAFAASPTTRVLAEGKQPVAPLMGLMKADFFYRRPVGKGFALIGDAGHFKDFVTGQGMTDAFLDAERMAVAVLDGRDEAYAHYWRERDVATLPLHFDALRQGAVGYNNPLMRWVIARLSTSPELLARMQLVFQREITPGEMIPTGALLRMVGAALARGRFNVGAGFLRLGKQLGPEQRELAARGKLLDSARAALDSAAPARPRTRQQHAA